MRRILIVLFVLITCVANARILHVGENTIKLSQTKTTTPALHVRVGGEVWYGAMLPTFVQNTLHIRYNDVDYSVLQCSPFIDTINYTYDENGRLIGANKNAYLDSNSEKYENYTYTNISGGNDNLSFEIKHKWLLFPAGNVYRSLFGNYNSDAWGAEDTNVTRLLFRGNNVTCAYVNAKAANGAWANIARNPNTVYIDYFDNEKHILNGKTLNYKVNHSVKGVENDTEIVLFMGTNVFNSTTSNHGQPLIYYFKIWDKDTLVRHFVPVPCGLQIGDFIVPENGMWDIVEQKFYGNMGTGEFIYGIDTE